MNISADAKISDSDKAEEAKNRLGISRTIYAVGYSLKDALIWGAGALAVLIPTLHYFRETRPIKWVVDTFGGHKENSFKARLAKKFPDAGPIVLLSFSLAWLFSHIVQIPSSVQGWKKAQAAIDKHNMLHAEKDQLVEANTVLMEDNEKLKAALAEAEKKRPPLTDRIRAQAAEAGSSAAL
jgi:hypothetical protein